MTGLTLNGVGRPITSRLLPHCMEPECFHITLMYHWYDSNYTESKNKIGNNNPNDSMKS
jgi:hypothetical protein